MRLHARTSNSFRCTRGEDLGGQSRPARAHTAAMQVQGRPSPAQSPPQHAGQPRRQAADAAGAQIQATQAAERSRARWQAGQPGAAAEVELGEAGEAADARRLAEEAGASAEVQAAQPGQAADALWQAGHAAARAQPEPGQACEAADAVRQLGDAKARAQVQVTEAGQAPDVPRTSWTCRGCLQWWSALDCLSASRQV